MANPNNSTIKIERRAEAHGTGLLTLELLTGMLHQLHEDGVPATATIRVHSGAERGENTSSWTLLVTW